MNFGQFLEKSPWWVPIVVIFGSAVGLHLVVSFIYKYAFPDEKKRGREWAASVLRAIRLPIKLLIWLSAVFVLVSMYASEWFDVGFLNTISKLFQVGFTAALSMAFYTFGKELEKHFLLKRHYDRTSVELFSKLNLMVIVFCTLLIVLPIFGVQIGGLLAFGGFSGIIVGFAAKDAIANIFGGIIIAFDRPFRIGERITTDNGNIEGYVEHIGWRLTKVRQLDKCPIFIPNSMFSNMLFTNITRASNRRVLKKLMIRYEDAPKVEMILEKIREYIKKHAGVDQDQSNYVHLTDFGESSIDILLSIYSKTVDDGEFREFQEKVLFDVYRMIGECGAQMAFPTQIIYMKKGGE